METNNNDLKLNRNRNRNDYKEPVSKGSKCSRCNKKGHDIKYCPGPNSNSILHEWSLVRERVEVKGLDGKCEGLKREGEGLKREGKGLKGREKDKGLKKYLAALCESSDEDG